MKPCIGPPIFAAAVTAPREAELRPPSRCSRMARVEASRVRSEEWRGDRDASGEGVHWQRRPRRADDRAMESIATASND